MTVDVNYWAILAVIVANVIIGFLWYGPLFGKKWMELSGITMPDPKPSMTVMIKPLIFSVIGAFLLGYVLTHGIAFGNAFLGTSGIWAGIMGAFWYWLGFAVPITLPTSTWEGKSWTLWFIHAGYWLVTFLVAGAIIGAWI